MCVWFVRVFPLVFGWRSIPPSEPSRRASERAQRSRAVPGRLTHSVYGNLSNSTLGGPTDRPAHVQNKNLPADKLSQCATIFGHVDEYVVLCLNSREPVASFPAMSSASFTSLLRQWSRKMSRGAAASICTHACSS